MVADFHNDYLTNENYEFLLKQYKNSQNIIVSAIFKGNNSYYKTLRLAEYFTKNKSDNLFLAYEDFSYDVKLSLLDRLLSFNPKYVTLTWNGINPLGGGCGSNLPISEKGLEVIKLLNDRKITIDLAHLGKRSFFEVIEKANSVVCSHACFNEVREHKRNLSSEQIKLIIEKGGIIGLTFYSEFLSNENATIDNVLRHIIYFLDRFSHKNLALGTDFFGCKDFPLGFNDYSFEEILRLSLQKLGLKGEIIDDIFYKNLRAFLQN